ncbi:MAG: hypothetical protein ABR881_05420 [Candidatus Sulfotelmatobacter sp.]|jgi:hypothetical protein
MNTELQEHLVNAENPRFSAFATLFWITLGTKTPAERRYKTRSCLAAGLLICWVLFALAVHFRPKPMIFVITDLLWGTVLTYIAWELRRYLFTLDELARRLQFEAMAWTYLTGFVLAAWLGVLAPFSHTLMHWPYKQSLLLLSPFLYFLLEPVRAGWLYYLSRRY